MFADTKAKLLMVVCIEKFMIIISVAFENWINENDTKRTR